MDKKKKTNGKRTKFLKVKMIDGDYIITSLRQVDVIAESKCLIALDRYIQYHSDVFRKIAPIIINPKFVIAAVRVDGWLEKKEG